MPLFINNKPSFETPTDPDGKVVLHLTTSKAVAMYNELQKSRASLKSIKTRLEQVVSASQKAENERKESGRGGFILDAFSTSNIGGEGKGKGNSGRERRVSKRSVEVDEGNNIVINIYRTEGNFSKVFIHFKRP